MGGAGQQQKALNPFASFVAKEYNAAKESIVDERRRGRGPGRPPLSESSVPHRDVMKVLSARWSEAKAANGGQ